MSLRCKIFFLILINYINSSFAQTFSENHNFTTNNELLNSKVLDCETYLKSDGSDLILKNYDYYSKRLLKSIPINTHFTLSQNGKYFSNLSGKKYIEVRSTIDGTILHRISIPIGYEHYWIVELSDNGRYAILGNKRKKLFEEILIDIKEGKILYSVAGKFETENLKLYKNGFTTLNKSEFNAFNFSAELIQSITLTLPGEHQGYSLWKTIYNDEKNELILLGYGQPPPIKLTPQESLEIHYSVAETNDDDITTRTFYHPEYVMSYDELFIAQYRYFTFENIFLGFLDVFNVNGELVNIIELPPNINVEKFSFSQDNRILSVTGRNLAQTKNPEVWFFPHRSILPMKKITPYLLTVDSIKLNSNGDLVVASVNNSKISKWNKFVKKK